MKKNETGILSQGARFPLGDSAWLDHPKEFEAELIRTAKQLRAAGRELPDYLKGFDPISPEKIQEFRLWILEQQHDRLKKDVRKTLAKK